MPRGILATLERLERPIFCGSSHVFPTWVSPDEGGRFHVLPMITPLRAREYRRGDVQIAQRLAWFSAVAFALVGAGCAGVKPSATGSGTAGNNGTDGGAARGGSDGPPKPMLCGNGMLDPGEQCDDGHDVGGQGCTPLCQIEQGWSCPTPGQPCVHTEVCGDGVLQSPEQCDDGNTANGDGCSSKCTVETGYVCHVPGKPCVPNCGDGIIEGTEQCDDGNTASGDGCSSTCMLECGWQCPPGTACRAANCGDGIVAGNEQCDDGNNTDGDGCSAICTLESKPASQPEGWLCTSPKCRQRLHGAHDLHDDGLREQDQGRLRAVRRRQHGDRRRLLAVLSSRAVLPADRRRLHQRLRQWLAPARRRETVRRRQHGQR